MSTISINSSLLAGPTTTVSLDSLISGEDQVNNWIQVASGANNYYEVLPNASGTAGSSNGYLLGISGAAGDFLKKLIIKSAGSNSRVALQDFASVTLTSSGSNTAYTNATTINFGTGSTAVVADAYKNQFVILNQVSYTTASQAVVGTTGSYTVTIPTTTNLGIGQTIVVASGTGAFTSGTTITNISGTTVTLSSPVLTTFSGNQTLTVTYPYPIARKIITHTATQGTSPNQFITCTLDTLPTAITYLGSSSTAQFIAPLIEVLGSGYTGSESLEFEMKSKYGAWRIFTDSQVAVTCVGKFS